MKKILFILLTIASISANAQIVNRFRDSTWFAKGVQFDSTLVARGLKISGAADTFVILQNSAGKFVRVGKNSFLSGVVVVGSGTVTNFIFTDGNGFDGTVTNSTTTPTLSLAGDTIYKFASVDRVLDSLIDVNARIKNGDSIYFFRTFAQLKSAMSAHTLKGGASYQMTDFTTIYDQPDFHANGTPKDTVVVKTASVEHLVFIANSDSTFDSYVSSIEYPSDRLTFDWNYVITESMSAPAKGRISERIDERNNRADYDFRKVLYLRYESSTGSGIFSEWKDNGEASQEFPTFNINIAFQNYFADSKITHDLLSKPFILSNIVASGLFAGMDIGSNVRNCTWLAGADGSYIGDFCQDLTFKGQFHYNWIGGNCSGIRAEDVFTANYIGETSSNVHFLGTSHTNSFWDKLTDCTFGDFIDNTIQYGEMINCTLGNNNTYGVWYGTNQDITTGDDNLKLKFWDAEDLVIGDDNISVDFSNAKNISASNDINAIKNTVFCSGVNGASWSNFITTGTHPELYLNVTKSIFLGGNGTDNTQDNVYSRYFNNSTDVITIID
jgi:hypothetical protein